MICCFPTILVTILQSFETIMYDRILIFVIPRHIWDEFPGSCASLSWTEQEDQCYMTSFFLQVHLYSPACHSQGLEGKNSENYNE